MLQHSEIGSPQTFTIAAGANGSAVTAVDLGKPFKFILITCADCQYIPATTNLSAQVGYDENDGPFALYEQDDPATQWSIGSLPTNGTLAFVLTHAAGARRLRLVMSNNSNGGATAFVVRGLDGGL
jgi:hypothetical protein